MHVGGSFCIDCMKKILLKGQPDITRLIQGDFFNWASPENVFRRAICDTAYFRKMNIFFE